MGKKLVFNHSVLLSKGWYVKSKYLWQDYRRTITCDGHYVPETRSDVAHILLQFVKDNKDKLFEGKAPDETAIINKIREKIDLIMYYSDYTDEYKGLTPIQIFDEACILYCHSVIGFSRADVFDKKLIPSEKVLPLNKIEKTEDGYQEHIKEMFGDSKPYDDEDEFSKSTFEDLDDYYKFDEWVKLGKLCYENKDKSN